MHLIVVTCTKSYAKVPACCCTIAIEYTIEVFLLRFYAKKYIFCFGDDSRDERYLISRD